jgi:hypothetical protein
MWVGHFHLLLQLLDGLFLIGLVVVVEGKGEEDKTVVAGFGGNVVLILHKLFIFSVVGFSVVVVLISGIVSELVVEDTTFGGKREPKLPLNLLISSLVYGLKVGFAVWV